MAWAQEQDTTLSAADSLLIEELAREMGAVAPDPAPAAVARTAPSLNPNISVIGDFRAGYASAGDRHVDAEFHEMEAVLQSVVDPYARGDFFIAAGHDGEGGYEFELEEAFLTTLSLPFRLQARAGKFRSAFGKINRLHPHALPYIDTPSVYANFLGDEGLNDQGLSVSWLLPNPRFFQDLTVEVTRGPGENVSYVKSDSDRLLYVGHLKNFWDLSADATLEVGFSGAAGPNEAGFTTWLGGIDATFKWKPVQFNTYHSFTLQAETIASRSETDAEAAVSAMGFYALASYQAAKRIFLVARVDSSDLPDDPDWNERAVSATLGWYATEFQKLELGLRVAEASGMERNAQLLVRAIFVIGSHGAHEY
ncbi:MAG: hypothetical protein R2834_08975 [Rhodothermales bacterium]